jgi:hypothetical protein
MVLAQDASGYAAREDRQIVLASDATFSWNAGTGVLSWNADIELLSTISGFKITIPAGNVTLTDGRLFYVVLTRAPASNITTSFAVASSVPNTDDAAVIGIRNGAFVYFRTGVRIANGESLNLFNLTGGGSTTNTYERTATFGVPEGNSTQEATLGRIVYAGSLVAVGAELTRPRTAGTVTVNVKVNGVTKMSVVLDASFPVARQSTVAGGTHPVNSNDTLSVEVVGASYANADSLTSGLTVTVALVAGLALAPGMAGFGISTEKVIQVPWNSGRASHDSSTPLVVGAFAFNPSDHTLTGTARSLVFRAVAINGSSPLTTRVRLVDTVSSDQKAELVFTNVTATTKLDATLVEGAGAGQIPLTERVYEVRILVDNPSGPSDTIELYDAELRVINTIS